MLPLAERKGRRELFEEFLSQHASERLSPSMDCPKWFSNTWLYYRPDNSSSIGPVNFEFGDDDKTYTRSEARNVWTQKRGRSPTIKSQGSLH